MNNTIKLENKGHTQIIAHRGICVLSQGTENRIQRLSTEEALHPIVQQCYKPKSVDAVMKTLDMVEKLLTDISIYHLSCNMDISAAMLPYQTMTRFG